MADYLEILDGQLDASSPADASLMTALARNPQAIAEGATGAPRIVDAALDDTVTTVGSVWVGLRMADRNAGSIGTFALLRNNSGSDRSFGQTLAGSSLVPVHAGGGVTGSARSGTWMCMGTSEVGIGADNETATTLWMRIA